MKLETRIYRRLASRQGLLLPGAVGRITRRSYHKRAARIAHYVKDRRARVPLECWSCEKNLGRKNFYYDVYDSPFEKTPVKRLYVCSEECDDYFRDTNYDFAYRECEWCNRYICERNPSNGWHEHFRQVEDYFRVCLSCFEEHLLTNGAPREKFERHALTGMFFSYGNTEAIEAGYEPVEGFEDYFVGDSLKLKEYCDKAIELIDSGFTVLNAWERVAIGGSEGTVSMLARKARESQAA